MSDGNGNKYQLLKAFIERAPELAAICLIVGMFLWHLGTVASQTLAAIGEVRGSLTDIAGAMRQTTVALTILSERSTADREARKGEHESLRKEMERSR